MTQIVLCRKNLRCKEWLPPTGPQTEYKPFLLTAFCHSELEHDPSRSRILTHGDSQFTWAHRSSTCGYVCICCHLGHRFEGLIDPLQLIPANRPGLAVARWRIRSHSDDLELEIFHEALVEPGLLEAIVLSVLLLRSGRNLGDTIEAMSFWDPNFFRPT